MRPIGLPKLPCVAGEVNLILSAGDLPKEYLGYIASKLNKPFLSAEGNAPGWP